MEPFDLRKCPYLREIVKKLDEPLIIDQIAVDSRRILSRSALFVALSGTYFDGHVFVKQAIKAGARFAIVKEGFPDDESLLNVHIFKVPDPIRALQQIAAAYRKEMKTKVIAITGSYGKTMTKDLLHHILSHQYRTCSSPESFNSQLGAALSLFKIKQSDEITLIEAGISKLDEMQRHADMILPDHAIVTNIGSAHIASLGSKQAIAQEKMRLLSNVAEKNWCLIPSDDAVQVSKDERLLNYFWDRPYADLPHIIKRESEEKVSFNYEIVFPSLTRTFGQIQDGLSYVLDLITIAVKAAHLLNVSEKNIIDALQSYFPEPMRIELWKSQMGTTIINDTYCGDPMSCDTALKQFGSIDENPSKFSGKKIFIFGGLRHSPEYPDSDMQRVSHAVAKHKVDLCILTQPEHTNMLLGHLNLISPQTEVVIAKDEKEAITICKNRLTPSDVVLIKGPKKRSVQELIREFDESQPNNQVIINLAAIQSNIEVIRSKLAKNTRIMVMVKALAYGTDDVRIAKFLKTIGIDILGVSYVDEGVSMRQAGVSQDIFVLNLTEYEAQKAVNWNLEMGVSEPGLIIALQKHAAEQNKKVKVHLHVDTGMTRFGCKINQVSELGKLITSCPNLIFEGIMTHFACADNPNEDAFTLEQAKSLQTAIESLQAMNINPVWKHAASSSAAIRFSFDQFNMIRIGLAAYGLHTSPATHDLINLRPAISLVSRIVGINECRRGDTISYGRMHTIQNDYARVAVLPIGYFDGLHRSYSGRGQVMIRGKLCPMIGKICMDYMMVDISHNPLAKIGDPALIFGEDENSQYLSPENLAQAGGSIVHELMTCLGPRLRRLFIYDEALRPR